jgi:hypothetical protein
VGSRFTACRTHEIQDPVSVLYRVGRYNRRV